MEEEKLKETLPEIKKILFPTKFRELAFNALESLLVLKDAGLREVVLCHIIPRDEVAFVPFGGYLKDEERRLSEEARIRFEDWQNMLAKKGIKTGIVIEVGDPVPGIISAALKENADLIVAGRKKMTSADKIFAGSHTIDILRRSPLPVLVSKYMVEFDWSGETVTRKNDNVFEKPLLATDWSGPSERALNMLASFKNVVRKAAVAHVMSVRKPESEGREISSIEAENKEKLKDYCKVLEGHGIEAECHLGAGKTADEILRISREVKSSMIIMGTTGKDRLEEFFLGSNSHKVAEVSELPTLLVPSK